MSDETYGLSRWIRVPGALAIGAAGGGLGILLAYWVWRGATGNTMPTWTLWFLIGSLYAQTVNWIAKEWRLP